jgi:AraC-like DNA-binding protein
MARFCDYPFHLEHCDILDRDPAWIWDTQGLEGRPFVVWLIAGGKGTLVSGEDFFSLKTGDCLISPLWQPHHGRHDKDDRLLIYWARVRFLSGNGRTIVPDPMPKKYRCIANVNFMRGCMERMALCSREGHPADALLWLSAAFIEIDRTDREESAAGAASEHHNRIKEIAKDLAASPEKSWHVAGLSRRLEITPDHFIRLFKKEIGQTPHEFLMRSRVESACNLLMFSSKSVTQISSALGFCDVHYFSKLFLKRMGVGPMAYRKGRISDNE